MLIVDDFTFLSFPYATEELGGDVFEVMTSLGDFNEFKELMLSTKRAKNAPNPSGGFGLDLCITGKHV